MFCKTTRAAHKGVEVNLKASMSLAFGPCTSDRRSALEVAHESKHGKILQFAFLSSPLFSRLALGEKRFTIIAQCKYSLEEGEEINT
jgi:hypothetical protein